LLYFHGVYVFSALLPSLIRKNRKICFNGETQHTSGRKKKKEKRKIEKSRNEHGAEE